MNPNAGAGKENRSALFASILVTVLALVALAVFVTHYNPNVIANIQYGPHNDRGANSLDLYPPRNGKKPYPLVVWIHGGGWIAGSKAYPPARLLAENGFIVASLNYRLAPEARFPAQIEDCKRAICWLRAHAKDYNIDPSRIGVWGASAGGHLVALLGTTGDAEAPGWAKPVDGVSNAVSAVCDWCGPGNLLSLADQGKQISLQTMHSLDEPISKFLGGPSLLKQDLAREASPIFYVHKGCPPFLIMHGGNDELVPMAQSVELKDALTKAGVPCQLIVVPNGGHNFYSDEAANDVLKFFQQTLTSSQQR